MGGGGEKSEILYVLINLKIKIVATIKRVINSPTSCTR